MVKTEGIIIGSFGGPRFFKTDGWEALFSEEELMFKTSAAVTRCIRRNFKPQAPCWGKVRKRNF